MNVTILGAGAWGTALALHCGRAGQVVTLVPRRIEQAMQLTQERENREYLPGFKLSPSIQIGLELRPALMEAEIILLACPMRGLRELSVAVQRELDTTTTKPMLVSLCTGLEAGTLERNDIC